MKQQGFTLIELLVVIAIISLLSSIVFASVNSAKEKAEIAKVMANAKQIKNAADMQYYDTGKVPGETNLSAGTISTGGALLTRVTDLTSGGYIRELPSNTANYIYYWYYSDIARNNYIVNYKCENDNVTKYIIAVWTDKSLNMPRMKHASTDSYTSVTVLGVPFTVYCLAYL